MEADQVSDEKQFSWQIEGTLPAEPVQGRVWRKPVWFQVAAPTMEEAIAKVRKRYSDVVFIKALKDRHVEAVIT